MFEASTRVAIVVAAAFAPGIVRAQPAPATISLQQAITYARAHQPSIAAARARIEVARATAQVPRAALAPRVTGAVEALIGTNNNTTASYATVGIVDVARIGGTPANAPSTWRPEPSTFAGVAVHQEIYDFGRIDAQADALDAFARSAEEIAKVAQLDLDLLVEESFYAVLGARAVLVASDAAVTRARAHRDFAQARVTAKLLPPIEVTRSDADLARFEVERVRAAGGLAIAQSVLAAAIGSGAPLLDAGSDDVTFGSPPPPANGIRDAGDRAPELRSARQLLFAQQDITRSIRDELRPDISLSAELSGRAGGAAVTTNPTPAGGGWVPDVPNWDALVVLSWPIYDRTVIARAKTSQRAEVVRAAEIAEVAEQFKTLAQRSYVELDLAGAALPALQRSLDAARANHDQAEARFNGGLATALELSDAEALLTDAQIELAIGQFHLSRARARLARVLAESTP